MDADELTRLRADIERTLADLNGVDRQDLAARMMAFVQTGRPAPRLAALPTVKTVTFPPPWFRPPVWVGLKEG